MSKETLVKKPRKTKAAKATATVQPEPTPVKEVKQPLPEQLAQVGPVSKQRSMAAILKFKNTKYKTEDVAVYTKELRLMNKFDLQKECIRLGRAAHDNRETMIERLVKDFKQHVAATNNVGVNTPAPIKLSNRSREILSRSGARLN